ncbi:MAG: hypothetical protein QOH71_2757 [Blastocatellia bacterium]|jgi:hypothetical protein|nr:hypothetical protein [Blastocatellia bacterium]
MKRCPKCDFSFVNFHRVCDFDGTDLVDDPDTLPVSPAVSALVAATQSPFLRLVKSPVFLMVLALAGIMSSALLFGYYDAASQADSIAKGPAAQDSPDYLASKALPVQAPARITTRAPSTNPNEVSTGRGSDRVRSRSEISKPKAKDLSSTRERPVTTSHSPARLRPSPAIRNQPSRPEIALQRQPKDKAVQKESKEGALQRDSKQNANRKGSKLTAALKSTWNVLKKPFKF